MASKLQDIFENAVDLRGGEREEYLRGACVGDESLRAEVDGLLRAHERAAGFMGSPTSDASGDFTLVTNRHGGEDAAMIVTSLRESPGTKIGPYKLLQLIGEGGFGSVFMAEQTAPVQRKVALKIIKLGMDTRQVVARFEQERQALAMMDHPNIAKVFDAGATDTGRPFFVMELVKGEAIVDYCDKNNLAINDRLELFAQVCNAVQHAHTKGIIHRDIKPSNVLVSTQDGRPHIKVIDFGIAKATASKLTEKTLFTEHKALIGTPEYMSPEQAEGNLDIDTRTDVYSLGVLLYELLTGTTPFSGKELRSAAYAELQRIIREVEPPNPSTRLSQNTNTIASIAAHRHTEPKRLGTIVRGELDWIVMRALEKDRQRRYETANGLAMDIRRYLAGEAVVAAPASTAYRFKKFVRRNKGTVTAGAVVALALVLGMVGTAWQAKRAAEQRDLAIAATDGETAQRKAAEAERDKAAKIADFMSDTLQGSGPSVAKGRDITMLKEMMDIAAARIEKGDLKAVPEAEVRLRLTIGGTYMELALYPQAVKMLEPAVSLARSLYSGDHEDTANALNHLASLLQSRGDLTVAEPLCRESLEMRKRLFPGDHPSVANGLNNLSELLKTRGDLARAEPLCRESLEMKKRLFPGDHPDVAIGLGNLAQLLQARGDLAGAEPLCRESLAMWKRLFPGDHPSVAIGLNILAQLLQARGDLAGAEPLSREALAMKKRLFPGDHPRVAAGLNNLATLLQSRGDLAGAEPLCRESLAMQKRLFPNDPSNVATSLNNLASLLQVRGDLAGAEPLYRESLAMNKRLFPGDHPDVAGGLNNLALLMLARGNLLEAEPLFREALAMQKRQFPGDHPAVTTALNSLAGMLTDRGELAGAEPLFRESLAMSKRLFPGDHREVARGLNNLANLLLARGDLAGAEPLAREGVAMSERTSGKDHSGTGNVRTKLGRALAGMNRFTEAETELIESERVLSTAQGVPPGRHKQCVDELVTMYESWDKAEPGKGHDAKAAEWKAKLEAVTPPTHAAPAGQPAPASSTPVSPTPASLTPASPAHANLKRFPATPFVVDVTKPPYNAKGDGVTDNTAAIQQAINDNTGRHRIIYFPIGTYLVSKPLIWSNTISRDRYAYGFNWVQGEQRDKTIIRLKDNTFTDLAKPAAILWCGGFGSADWFNNYVEDLTFDVGRGNPGAIGLQFYSNNTGAVRNCTIISQDGQGAIGLDLGHRDMNGPLLIHRVSVSGFARGIVLAGAVNSQTFEHITLRDQTDIGFDNHGQAASIRGLISDNAVPAVRTYGTLSLIDATLTGRGSAKGVAAIVNYNGGRIALRDIVTSGYSRALGDVTTPDSFAALRITGPDKPGSQGPVIPEYFSHAATSPFDGPVASLRLPILETPEVPWDDPATWAVVDTFGADPTGNADSSEAIQKAIDSGASTIFFPGFYVIEKPVIVRGKARRLLGTGTWIDYNAKTRPNFVIADGQAGEVVIEHFFPIGGGIEINTDRTVVLRSIGCSRIVHNGKGRLFLEDVATDQFRIGPGQKLWARQLNIENEGTHLINDGGELWILGYKTERGGTLLHTLGNGQSEVFGTFSYTTTAGKLAPMFVTEDARAFAFFAEVCYTGDPFAVLIRESRSGVVKEFERGKATLIPYIGVAAPAR